MRARTPQGRSSLGLGLRCAMLALLCMAAAGCATDPMEAMGAMNATTAAPPVAAVGSGDAVTQRLAEVSALAGPPVSSFRYMDESTFEPIGLSDLLVYTNPREAWLLHLDGECRDLDFGPFLKLTSHMHRVSTLTDSVIVRDNPIPCMIKQIRPVDAGLLRRVQPDVNGEINTSVGSHH